MARIIYISTRTKTPSGGVKVIFQHVQGLIELGYDAFVGHPIHGYTPDWFEADIPILYYLKGLKVYPDDVFVIPETGFNTLRLLKDIRSRKVMFCQNWFGVKQGLGDAGHWRDFNIGAVMTCSHVVERCAREAFGFPLTQAVTCPIDDHVFSSGAVKKRQIAYMPRKRQADISEIKLFYQLLMPSSKFEWIPIDGKSQAEVAHILGESAIFLSLSKREGLGLPPLEAMASGCLVAGFHGIGGMEYASSENGFWCDEDDLFGCASALAEACRTVTGNKERAFRMIKNGMETAKKYSFINMRTDLDRFWGRYFL